MTRILVIIALVIGARTARADTCVVRGSKVSLEKITVRPPGADAFTATVRDVPAAATLPSKQVAPLTLEIGGALEFAATRDDVWLRLARDMSWADGTVIAKRGARVIDAYVKGDRVIASAVLYSNDVLEGEKKRPFQVVRGLDLPCDALTLDAVEMKDDEMLEPAKPDPAGKASDESIAHTWQLRRGRQRLTLRREPKTKATGYVIEEPNCEDGCIDVVELERKGAWIRVETFGEGFTVRGWARTADLKRMPDGMAFGRSYGCYGDHETDEDHMIWSAGTKREGTIRSGTIVYANEATGAWGRFASTTRVRVHVQPGSSWATLLGVQGVWHISGVVPLDTLTLDPLPAPTTTKP